MRRFSRPYYRSVYFWTSLSLSSKKYEFLFKIVFFIKYYFVNLFFSFNRFCFHFHLSISNLYVFFYFLYLKFQNLIDFDYSY